MIKTYTDKGIIVKKFIKKEHLFKILSFGENKNEKKATSVSWCSSFVNILPDQINIYVFNPGASPGSFAEES